MRERQTLRLRGVEWHIQCQSGERERRPETRDSEEETELRVRARLRHWWKADGATTPAKGRAR